VKIQDLTRQRISLVALVFTLMFALGVGPEDSDLVFLDESPLQLVPETVEEGTDVAICNLGEQPLTNIAARATGFNLPAGKQLNVIGGRIGELPRGECEKVTLQADQDLGEDVYQGLLTVSADEVKGIARQVVIGPPAPEKISAAAKPIRLLMWWPSNITRLGSPDKEFELPLKSEDAATLQTEAGETLGTLSGGFGDGHAEVVAADAISRSAEGGESFSLPVRVNDLDGVGTYTGTLTIDGAQFEPELFVSDSLLWALVPLLIGAGVGWFLLIELKKRWPMRTLRQRGRALQQTYADANEQFRTRSEEIGAALRAAGASDDDVREVVNNLNEYEVDLDRVLSYQNSFNAALDEYGKEITFVDTSTEGYKQIVAMLDDAEADARRLQDSEGLRRPLEDLALALHRLATYLESKFGEDRRPALSIAAAAPLKGKSLKVGATKELSDKAKGWTDLVAMWRMHAERLKFYEAWGANLERKRCISVDDRKIFGGAIGTVAAGRNELLDAEDAAALIALSTSRELRQAYNSIAQLGKKYRVSPEPASAPPAAQHRRLQRLQQRFRRTHEEALPDDRTDLAVGRWVDAAKRVRFTEQPRTVTEMDPPVGRVPSWVLPALGGIVALLTVLVAEIYPDGGVTFGTTKDYLAAFVAGATGTAVAQFLQGPLAAFVTRLRPGS
jgi:hypothetical protein